MWTTRLSGLDIRENEIRAGNGSVEGYLAAVDPGDGQSQRFAADEIGELRLPGVQDLVLRDARILDQVAKQRAVRLVAIGPLRGAYQVEVSLQWRQRQKIIVDVGHHRESVMARQLIQSTDDIVVKKEARERLEVTIDQPAVARRRSKCANVSASENSQISRYERYVSQ